MNDEIRKLKKHHRGKLKEQQAEVHTLADEVRKLDDQRAKLEAEKLAALETAETARSKAREAARSAATAVDVEKAKASLRAEQKAAQEAEDLAKIYDEAAQSMDADRLELRKDLAHAEYNLEVVHERGLRAVGRALQEELLEQGRTWFREYQAACALAHKRPDPRDADYQNPEPEVDRFELAGLPRTVEYSGLITAQGRSQSNSIQLPTVKPKAA